MLYMQDNIPHFKTDFLFGLFLLLINTLGWKNAPKMPQYRPTPLVKKVLIGLLIL